MLCAFLQTFREFDRGAHAAVLGRLYAVDCLLSILRLRESPGYGKVVLLPVKNAVPSLHVSNGWHPCLAHGAAVKNTYHMGGGACPPGLMLTGPNAGGKSTLLKSMMINVLMAQALLTAAADCVQLTPFRYLNSQVNVPDCKGRTSLFEAEMLRAKGNVDALRALKQVNTACAPSGSHFAFVIMDEIFSSTNPVEGIAGGYAVAKNIAATGVCVCAISTHFTYLCKLAKRTGLFQNWQMPVAVHAGTSDFEYPYKLCRGICTQYIAIELLRRTQFDECIVQDALRVKHAMVTSPTPPADALARRAAAGKKKKKKLPRGPRKQDAGAGTAAR